MSIKKRIVYFVLILIVSFSFAGNVFAEEFSAKLNYSNTVISKGDIASFKIELKSSEIIAECLLKIENGSNLEYVSSSGVNGWTYMNGENGFSLSNTNLESNLLSEGSNVLELKYRVNGDGAVKIKVDECVSIKEKIYTYDEIKVEYTAKEKSAEDAVIGDLAATNGSVSRVGDQFVINLKSTTFGLSITTANPEYQNFVVVKDSEGKIIKDINNITFNDPTGQGLMMLYVAINNAKFYDVFVYYGNNEFDNSLKSLTINGKAIDLEKGRYAYTYMVSKDVTSVEIVPELNDTETFKLAGNYSGKHSFSDNVIYLVIDVVPKDTSSGAKKITYHIEVKKEGTNDTGGSNNNVNVPKNPTTADMPMFLMAFILIVSLVGSVVLYQKNIQSYK